MKKTKDQKVALVKELTDSLKNATSTVFVHFNKLNVAEETVMRRELRNAQVKYTVVKKTLVRRALDSLGLASKDAQLDGEIALAYGGGDDATAAARLVNDFGKKYQTADKKNKIHILGGIFEGKLISQASMQEIATIPSMQTLRAMFAQIINSPRQRFAVVLGKVAEIKE